MCLAHLPVSYSVKCIYTSKQTCNIHEGSNHRSHFNQAKDEFKSSFQTENVITLTVIYAFHNDSNASYFPIKEIRYRRVLLFSKSRASMPRRYQDEALIAFNMQWIGTLNHGYET